MDATYRSRMYNIQFSHREKSYSLNISEVALAHGAIAYAVKLLNYKGLFIECNNQWKVMSKSITSEGMKKQIIKQLQLHGNLLRLLDHTQIRTSLLL